MKHPVFTELQLTLAGELADVTRVRKSIAGRSLARRRKELRGGVLKAVELRDLRLLIALEIEIVRGDLAHYVNSLRMRGSLKRALDELQAIQAHLDYVADKAVYAIIDQTHSLPKKRLHGLPRDDARMALASHLSRLGNMDKSRLDEEEKEILSARLIAVKTMEELYIALQQSVTASL